MTEQRSHVWGRDERMTIMHINYTNEFMLIGVDGFKIGIYGSRADADRARILLEEAE